MNKIAIHGFGRIGRSNDKSRPQRWAVQPTFYLRHYRFADFGGALQSRYQLRPLARECEFVH